MVTVSTLPQTRAYHHGDLRSALVEAGLKALQTTPVEDLSLRALVAETPAAEHEHREARRHADAMARHRAELVAQRADLTARMDELLDRMKDPQR